MSNNDIHLIDGPEAWHGKDLVSDERWRLCLDDGDIVEIDRALQNVKERGLAWSDMTRIRLSTGPGLGKVGVCIG